MIDDDNGFRQMNNQSQLQDDVSAPAETKDPSEASLLDMVPPEQIRWDSYGEIGVYGMSLQGRSHQKKNAPCQDSNNFCYLENEKLLIAAIADGVGSCIWSHWGSYMAVEAAILSLKREIPMISKGEVLKIQNLTENQIESLFDTAFSDARRAVEELADKTMQAVYNFESTLTVALYDGGRLTCCHIGDDGIVAQGVSGKYQMITQRIKGDETNSVYTLQSGKRFITTTGTDVTGFLMTTDGILDFYVMNQAMNNRVYYPFFEACIYPMEPKQTQNMASLVESAMQETQAQLLNDAVMGSVTDDMTVLAVVNQRLLCQSEHPVFSEEEWNREMRRVLKMQQEKLHPSRTKAAREPAAPQKPEPRSNPASRAVPSNQKSGPAHKDKHNRKPSGRSPYDRSPYDRTPEPPYPPAEPPLPSVIAVEEEGIGKLINKISKSIDKMGRIMFGEETQEVGEGLYIYYYSEDELRQNGPHRNELGRKKTVRSCPYPGCGNTLSGTENFCPRCGKTIKK